MIIIPDLKIGYQDVPKVASTSFFNWFYQCLYRREFDPYNQDAAQPIWIHMYFRMGRCPEALRVDNKKEQMRDFADCYRFTITRDPVKRFLSMYSNRVLHHRELAADSVVAGKLAEAGLAPDPDINTLVDNIEAYMNCQPSIHHHGRPMIDFLGPDLTVYERFFDISETHALIEEIKDHWVRNEIDAVHRVPKLSRDQTGGRKLGLSDLTPESFEKLLAYYSEDYERVPSVSLESIKEEYSRTLSGSISVPDLISNKEWIDMNEKKQNASDSQAPFIIWTFRRTGGTNLGGALFERSPFEGVKHEPFNPDRIFGEVTRNWLKNKNEASLHAELTEICEKQVLIKHCLEIIPQPLNQALAEISTRLGYRHLFLYRRRPIDRLLSLHFAQKSGAWGKEMAKKAAINDEIFQAPLPLDNLVAHEIRCRRMIRAIFDQLCGIGARPLMLTFEDLYTNNDTAEARRQIKTVLAALGLERGDVEDDRFMNQVLTRGNQGTRDQYKRFADYDKLAEALGELGEFTLQKERLPRFWINNHVEPHPDILECVLWDPKADVQVDAFVVSGAVVLAPDAPSGCRLLFEDAEGCREVHWGLDSPRIAARFPDNRNATHARFKAEGVRITGDHPATLVVEYPGNVRRPLASVHMKADARAEKCDPITLKAAAAGSL